MPKLNTVAINGNVSYFKEDGTWDHSGGVHANSTPASARPLPTDNNMSWAEASKDGTDQNSAVMTSMEEAADLIVVKGNCFIRHNVKLAADAPKVEMTIRVRKTGGTNNQGEASVTYSDEPQARDAFHPFDPHATILTT